jgi:uncharacterized protein (TIGR02284 family)
MDREEIIRELTSLAQLDIDSSYACSQAIGRIRDPEIRQDLTRLRHDHERHIRHLADLIANFGEAPPQHAADLKGLAMEMATALRGITGTRGALAAMQRNEQQILHRYQEAGNLDFPSDIKALIEEHCRDEQEHLARLERTLAELE